MRRTLFTFLSAIALVATGVVGAIAVGGTGTVDPPPKIAFLANGIVPADALAAGGIAGQLGAPLFTTRADSLNDDARDGIKAYDPELVIALGGPVAINDSVLDALAAATGLTRTTADAPTSGIVRAAGGDRFATARAVADLLADYDPAYLPVDATALGAVDADMLDGMDSTEFALSDQSCDPGDVVTEIDVDGELVCAPDNADGGDADTLDGLDATRFAPAMIEEGETLTGTYYRAGTASGPGHFLSDVIDFIPRLASAPTDYVVVDDGSTAPGCTGDSSNPTAEPGFMCVYVTIDINVTIQHFGSMTSGGLPADDTKHAVFLWESAAAGSMFVGGTYAVTPGPTTRSASTVGQADTLGG